MTEVNEHRPGTFCWIELGTTDAASAKAFYSELFGWQADDRPVGPDFIYTMLQLRGREVGALYELDEDRLRQGVPPHWLSYVSVADVNESVPEARSLAGTILVEPMEVMEAGRMAVVQDPTGGTLGLWEAGDHPGARIINEPGALCWNELLTDNIRAAGDFYANLFGWHSKVSEIAGIPYTQFLKEERPAGGMFQMGPEMKGVPAHWMPYISVGDCDGTLEKARSLGAEVLVPATDVPTVGRFATIRDPQGAAISVIRMESQ